MAAPFVLPLLGTIARAYMPRGLLARAGSQIKGYRPIKDTLLGSGIGSGSYIVGGALGESFRPKTGTTPPAPSPAVRTPAPTADKPPFEKQTGGMNSAELDAALLRASGNKPAETERTNMFNAISSNLSNPDNLQKILTGIALLEGTPVEEAVKLGSAIGAIGGRGGSGDLVEVYDRKNNSIVFSGYSDDSRLRQYMNNPGQYQILDAGTLFDKTSGQLEAASGARLESSQKQLEEFSESVMQAQELAGKVNEVLDIVESEKITTGKLAQFATRGAALAGGDTATYADMIESLQTQLATLMRMPGSGSTSDLEFDAYRDATIGLGKTKDFNVKTLRKIQVASRILDARMSYVDEMVFEEGKSFSQAMAEFSQAFNDRDAVAAGSLLDVDAVIFDEDDMGLLEKGGKYLFLNQADKDTYNTIDIVG